MPTTEAPRGAGATLLAVLVAANGLLFGAWPWLRSLPLGADSTDALFRTTNRGSEKQTSLIPEAVLRNSAYLSSFFDAIRANRAVLFLGTSETVSKFNLGAQLNALFPGDPRMVVLAKPGTSPIHSALLFASCKREGLMVPPLVLVINPVYLTYSHDVIDDGWMTSLVRSDVFAQLDHRRLMQELTPGVRTLYAQHFESRRMLLPFYAQEYLGNLLYLAFHQTAPPRFSREELGIPEYEFDGSLPDYDVERGVHLGYQASDQLAKDRWLVKPVEDCLNLQGLAGTMAILTKQRSPVLLLVLPVNRRFYAFNGLDMAEFERRYQALRGAIRRFEEPGHIFVADFYEAPWLKLGFADRMHADASGFHQIAVHLGDDSTYARFLDAVRAYYGNLPMGGDSPTR
jgi:hypothetical protein